jgi:tetratricopeptide (TPR) repeat protein
VPDDLAGLLAAGERAAFHGRPGAGVDPLRRAVDVARAGGLTAEAAAAGWLLGVCLSSAGRYGTALEVLDPLVAGEGTPESQVLAALASATTASIHRQLGRHAVAQGYDERALAGSQGSGEAGFDALLGLSADAIGLGDRGTATARLDEASALAAGRSEWWRQRVRLGWVQAEVALLAGNPADAVQAASAAVDLAEQAGAPRHVAKGLLFLGVAQVEAGRPEDAAGVLRRAGLLAGAGRARGPVGRRRARGERPGPGVGPWGGHRHRRRPPRAAAGRVAGPPRRRGPAAGLSSPRAAPSAARDRRMASVPQQA